MGVLLCVSYDCARAEHGGPMSEGWERRQRRAAVDGGHAAWRAGDRYGIRRLEARTRPIGGWEQVRDRLWPSCKAAAMTGTKCETLLQHSWQ